SSYIASVLATTTEIVKFDNDIGSTQTTEVKHEPPKIFLQSADKPKQKALINAKNPELADKKKNKSKWINAINSLNNLWMGFLGFVGLEV
ncbi:hypothetical protein, partial [Vibrio cholerae]|uniref:hypothetical protein n=1 Tax=Vibrio cholerae TaxID=666 RepID=UPI0018F08772